MVARGLNTGWSTPLISPQRKRPPPGAHWEGNTVIGVALKFTGVWGSWGSEVPRLTSLLHLPDQPNPLLDSLTPMLHIP